MMNFFNKRKNKKRDQANKPPDVAISLTPCASSPANMTAASTNSEDADHEYSGYLGNPPRGKRAVSFDVAMENITKDGFESKMRGDVATAKMLVFLYGRGFLTKKTKLERVRRVKEMISPKQANKHQNSPKTILLNLIAADGDKDMSNDPKWKEAYIRHRISIERYIQQKKTFGCLDVNSVDPSKDYINVYS
jgi:hypothetical protein